MRLKFKLYNGEELSFQVTKKTCVIGRSSQCDVIIPHEGMSRKHCMLTSKNGTVFVTDLGSTNGVYIDGQRIETGKAKSYPTYLALSFGYVQTLQVELDEYDTIGDEEQGPTSTDTQSGTTTKTKPLNVKKKKKFRLTKEWLLPKLILLGLALAVYATLYFVDRA